MTSRKSLERRIGELEEPEDLNDLPMLSLAELIAADEIESTPHDGVVLLDGQRYREEPLRTALADRLEQARFRSE